MNKLNKDIARLHHILDASEQTVWNVVEHKLPALRDWVEGILEKITS